MSASECHEVQFSRRAGIGLLGWIKRQLAISRQHRHLARLDDAALRDLGLTRADVARELAQPFWMQPGFGEVTQPRQAEAARMARYRPQ